MKAVVDGIIYSMAAYGIPNVFREILPRMCDLEPNLEIKLLLSKQLQQSPPAHENIVPCWMPRIERYLRVHSLDSRARQIIQQFYTGLGKNQIWHSTNYTNPWRWDGARVTTVHDLIIEIYAASFPQSNFIRTLQSKKRSIKEADIIICVSQTTAQDLQTLYGVDQSRICVVYNGVSEVYHLVIGSGMACDLVADRPFILYVGARYRQYKNFDGLLSAYSQWRYHSEVSLVVVGKPWSEEEIRQLNELGLAENTHLLTNCSDQELCLLYNSASALVYPSKYEGFGLPLLEAMRCGCPIIASRIPSTVEVAGEVPIYFNLAEADSMRAAFDQVLQEGRDSSRMKAGLERACLFSWERAAYQVLEVYHSLSV